jgi:hypothetical protein
LEISARDAIPRLKVFGRELKRGTMCEIAMKRAFGEFVHERDERVFLVKLTRARGVLSFDCRRKKDVGGPGVEEFALAGMMISEQFD